MPPADHPCFHHAGGLTALHRNGVLFVKRVAAELIACLPVSASGFLVRRAAQAHPSLKTPLFERILSKVAERTIEDIEFVETNMGISSRLRCKLPLAKPHYLFGRPQNNVSERSTCELVGQLSEDCSNFVDIGANEGLFTFTVHELRGKRNEDIHIHFFEPDDCLYERLSENLAANHICAQGNKAAVARQSGTAVFLKNLDDDLSGSLTDYFSKTHRTRPELVETVSLEDYFSRHHLDRAIVKIDVEGAGADVWAGARGAIPKIEHLVIEIIEPEVKSKLPQKIISETGWKAYYIRDYDLIHSVGGEFTYVSPFWNWLFCRLSPADLAKRLLGTRFPVMEALPAWLL
jgi:FkbM family methyltransferase